MDVNCLHCGRGFKARRSTAKYCSGKCRSNASIAVKRRAVTVDIVTVDPDTVDPRAIYAAIAMDPTASASARIQAAKALQAAQKTPSAGFDVNARAAQILAAGRRLN